MGIRGLNTLISRYSPDAVTENNIKHYKGKVFAIDCSILIYKYVHMSKVENSHIIGFANRISFYLKNDILPVFVFDGTPPDAKKNVLQKRQNNRKRIQDKITELEEDLKKEQSLEDRQTTQDKIEKLNNQVIYVNKYHILECKKLLECLGIPYIQAEGEAEKTCVYLKKINLVDYVVSDDTDTLTFGCENVLKTNIKGNLQEITLSSILSSMEMSYQQFVDLCIIAGCDYCPYIPSVGPLTAYNLIKNNKTIEGVVKLNKYKITDEFDFENARKLFMDYSELSIEKEAFKKSPLNSEELSQFLSSLNFKDATIKKYISTFS
jgi:flap endonuclease-1